MANCLICQSSGVGEQNLGGPLGFHCLRCGMFTVLATIPGSPMTGGLGWFLDARDADAHLRRSRLSHLVRRQQDGTGRYVGVPIPLLGSWGLDDPLPSPAEQFDGLIEWVGDQQGSYVDEVPIRPLEMAAWMGAPIKAVPATVLGWLLKQPGAADLVEKRTESLRLTMRGWERHAALKRQVSDSRTAFMAMKFDDAELDDVLERCFKPAATAAGYDLKNLAEGQPTGIIDDQMRVGIRRARFVIADLTHGSRGAYWEAGFAEGAGKPVVYTCRKSVWKAEGSHFDTNHLSTIVWDPDDLPEAQSRLTAMIRATLPGEAKLE